MSKLVSYVAEQLAEENIEVVRKYLLVLDKITDENGKHSNLFVFSRAYSDFSKALRAAYNHGTMRIVVVESATGPRYKIDISREELEHYHDNPVQRFEYGKSEAE